MSHASFSNTEGDRYGVSYVYGVSYGIFRLGMVKKERKRWGKKEGEMKRNACWSN